tara:strand:+ start:242 stop:469 length:228 start_codon:yes stop_codon:yes gene_type:complete
MKITKCNHVTQTEKNHLKAFLKSGLIDAKINTKFYSVISSKKEKEKTLFKIRICSPYKNDLGIKKYDIQNIEILN